MVDATPLPDEPAVMPNHPVRLGKRLSHKFLLLTIVFVMLAEVLIFVPSIANMRIRWLQDRLNTAAAASLVFDSIQAENVPADVRDSMLMATGTAVIILYKASGKHIIAMSEMPVHVDAEFNVLMDAPYSAIREAFVTLFTFNKRYIRVKGPVAEDYMSLELIIDETPLRDAMLVFGKNVLFLSLLISFITAGLVFFSINAMLIRPIQRMSKNMRAFALTPDDPNSVISPSTNGDELSVTEQHLSRMQRELQSTLKSRRNLAELGLAVSKINHDMRNILASAQLMSDRLSSVDDPIVRRIAPKLLKTMDRAVNYTKEVMAYGKAQEPTPKKCDTNLFQLIDDIRVSLLPAFDGATFNIDVEKDLSLQIDSEHVFRAINNLCRNALQAIAHNEGSKILCVSATNIDGAVQILISDNGPGIPKQAQDHLFEAFRGSTRSGGTGLGLAIARELIHAHNGTITHVQKDKSGTTFEIILPK